MPFDGIEADYAAELAPKHAPAWRNYYRHPVRGATWGKYLWPTKEAAVEAIINDPHTEWGWPDGGVVKKADLLIEQRPWTDV